MSNLGNEKSWQRPVVMLVLCLIAAGITSGKFLFSIHYPSTRHSFSTSYNIPAPPEGRRIAIVQYASDQSSWLAQESIRSHREYAEIHGYSYHLFNESFASEAVRPFLRGQPAGSRMWGYNKLAYILDVALDAIVNNTVDWILWADSDTLVIEPGLLLESFVPDSAAYTETDTPYLIIASDENGINDGSMLLRANHFTFSLLAQCIADPYQHHSTGPIPLFSDQRSLSRIISTDAETERHVQHMDKLWFDATPAEIETAPHRPFQIHLVGSIKHQNDMLAIAKQAVDEGWQRFESIRKAHAWKAWLAIENRSMANEVRLFYVAKSLIKPPFIHFNLFVPIRQLWLMFIGGLATGLSLTAIGLLWMRRAQLFDLRQSTFILPLDTLIKRKDTL